MTPAATQTDLAPGLENCFLFDAVEDSYEVSGIQGAPPAWLRGAYYVNGPARFERDGLRYKHWLDGDGMICSLRFTPNGVHFANRFVNTPKRAAEDAAGKFLFRGFGTAFPGDRLRNGVMLEPPVNVSAYYYDGRLLAFGEQSLPYDLDPVTLETRGEYDFHGKLNIASPFAAHAKIDGHLMNFGVQFAANKPTLNVYEFDAAGALLRRQRHNILLPHSVHDFGFTPHHFIFHLSPLLMDFGKFVTQGASVMESLSWEPERGTRMLILPRHAPASEAFWVEAGRGYALHFINCFESAGRLTVDLLELEAPVYFEYEPVPDFFPTVAPCRPVRFTIDLATRTLVDTQKMDYQLSPDFSSVAPHLAGRDYNDFWMLGISHAGKPGRKFFNQLAHGDWRAGAVNDIFETAPGFYLGGEPTCVCNPADPGEAVVIVEHIDALSRRGEFLLFDAFHVARGPLARLPLRHQIHPGFHSSFAWEVQ